MSKKLTIRDIAQLAGVSKSTVSRVLNAKQDVDLVTRERVLQIVKDHAFVLDMSAAKLAGGQSRLIGALVPPLAWPLMPEIMRGISEAVAQSPYELLLYSITDEQIHHEKEQREVISRILQSNLASGLLAVFPGPSTPYLIDLYKQGFPVVILDDREELTQVPWVTVDNRGGARDATRYLLQLGHRRIAYIYGPSEYRAAHERYLGYCDALQEVGMVPDPELVQQGDFTPSSGRAATDYFLSLSDRPTAIFASNDQVAFDVFAVADDYGLRVPEHISVVGFDDIASSLYSRPALTTVRQPFYEMGKQATELLLAQSVVSSRRGREQAMSQEDSSNTRSRDGWQDVPRVCLATNLVVRASCRALSVCAQ